MQLPDPISNDDIVKTLGEVLDGANIPDAVRLNPMEKLSYYFPGAPVGGKLHLIIQVPAGEHRPATPSCPAPLTLHPFVQRRCQKQCADRVDSPPLAPLISKR